MDSVPNYDGKSNEKMGIIATDGGAHIVTTTENKKNIEFICRYHRSVNEPSVVKATIFSGLVEMIFLLQDRL